MSTTTATNLTGFETRCPNCAAAISYNPEDVIITCEYCGTIVNQKGETIPNHYMLQNTLTDQELVSMIQKWLPSHSRIKKDLIAISSVRPMLIPYWAIQVKADTHYIGYLVATDYREEQRTRTVTDAKGNSHQETYTEQIPVTVYRPVDKEIHENDRRVLLSRQGALFFGQDKIEEVLNQEINEAKPFDIEMVKNTAKEVKFLSGEIEESDARELISSKTRADHRSEAHKNTTELFDCRTAVSLGEAYFVHYPFWLVEYTYEGKSYRVSFDGYKKEIVKGETPVTSFTRIVNFVLTLVAAVIGSGVLIFVDLNYSTMNTNPNNVYFFAALIPGIIFYAIAVFFYSRVYKISGLKNI